MEADPANAAPVSGRLRIEPVVDSRDGAASSAFPGQIIVRLGLPEETLRGFGSLSQQRRMAGHLRAQTLAALPPSQAPGDRLVLMRTLTASAASSLLPASPWNAAWWGAALGIGGGLLLLFWPRWSGRRSRSAGASGDPSLDTTADRRLDASPPRPEQDAAGPDPSDPDWSSLRGQLSAQILAAPRQAARVVGSWSHDSQSP